jgi:hypothetical protein
MPSDGSTSGTEHPGPSETRLAPHVQTHPGQDITFYTDGGEVYVLFVSEPPSKGLFKVVEETHNPRVLTRFENAVVRGYLVTPTFEPELERVSTHHMMAGRVHKFPVDKMLDDPALLLERIPHPSLEDTS